jgi:hypothetical protein
VARREVTGRKRSGSTAVVDSDAFGIREFCQRHGFSVQLFFKYREEMPDTFRIGGRVLISREAAARWRAEREGANA